jgi:hypothetical protein
MRTKPITVKSFVELVEKAGACKEGLASFKRKKGTVRQRIAKMCGVANSGNAAESTHLRWLCNGPEGDSDVLGFNLDYSYGKGWGVADAN